jgi:uncharacterized protein YndB with AHSA1/START domain
MRSFLPPNGFTCKVYEQDARVGGKYRMSFTNFATGSSHSFGGEYIELIPNQKIVNTDTFEDPNMPGEMKTTVELREVAVGTEVHITQE